MQAVPSNKDEIPMMRSFTLCSVLICLFFASGSSFACPASYVKGMADVANQSPLGDKIGQISDKYLILKGISPESMEGLIMKPYVVGTTWVDHLWGIHWIDQKSVDECVQDCLDCAHHNLHFGDAQNIYNQSLPPVRSRIFGG